MNQWGAVKLGLVVATAGALGVLGTSKNSVQTRNSPHAAFHLGSMNSMISGSAQSLGESYDGGGSGGSGAVAAAPRALRGFSGNGYAQKKGLAPEGAVRKIVRTASLCFEVKDQSKARALVRSVIFRNGAELFSEESAGDGDNQAGTIVIEAPPDKVEAIIKELEPLGRSISRSVSSENMSEEYVDLKSRLQNALTVERRLTELMAFKTNKLPDILQLERELERVGAEIEQIKGRMKYIDTLAATSRITVRMAQPAVVEASQTPGVLTEVRNSLVGSFNTFVTTGLSLLNLTGFMLALGLWTLPVAGVVWLLKKKIWG